MLYRVAVNLKKVIFRISDALLYISMVTIILAMLVVIADVVARRVFNAPIHGSRDLYCLAFSMIVFLPMAWCANSNNHIELNFLVDKFPKTVQRILEFIMMFITVAVLGLMSWQLFVHGTLLQSSHGESGNLNIILYPFVYLAAFGSLMLTLAFLIRFIRSIGALIDMIKERL